LLSAREHSRAELERKLASFEEAPGQLARVLDALQAKDFINEGRVVESVVHRRAGKLGASRIKQELQAKGLEPQARRGGQACAPARWSGRSLAQEVGNRADANERASRCAFG
jgi:regulatory protein